MKEISLEIQVVFSTPALSGLKEFVLDSQDCIDYAVCYIPSATGCRSERYVLTMELYFIVDFLKLSF